MSNESLYRIDTIRLTALIDAKPCTMRVTQDTNMPIQASRRDPGAVLGPSSKAMWELTQDTATADSYLSYFFQFRDEAGGFWVIDDEGRLSIDADYTDTRQPLRLRVKGRLGRLAIVSRWVRRD